MKARRRGARTSRRSDADPQQPLIALAQFIVMTRVLLTSLVLGDPALTGRQLRTIARILRDAAALVESLPTQLPKEQKGRHVSKP